ncbi:MAG: hypothetical protein UZ21_OP11001000181 [Microgenomates bacterium OLB22]|nr:MAG: hypothetical protein UZ21_OP11001000181 [Microgenomates bacterium OLB22]
MDKKRSSFTLYPQLQDILLLCLTTVGTTLLLWLPFILHIPLNNLPKELFTFDTILKHWDGLLYVIVAKTWYDPMNPILQSAPLGLSPIYFAAHQPLYPITIAMLTKLLSYPYAMLVSTLIASCGLATIFYLLVTHLKLSKRPLLLTLCLMLLIPRFVLVRSVGSSEPLFMLLILLSVWMVAEKHFFWAALAGMFAIMTRTPAALLGIAYAIIALLEWYQTKKINWQWGWILLMPLGLLGVFYWYGLQYQDVLAYFHSGDNLHLTHPLAVFNHSERWVGTAWLEDVAIYFILFAMTLIWRWETVQMKIADLGTKDRFEMISTIFMFVYISATIMLDHRDIPRYSLPMIPFVLLTFESFFTSKKFQWVLILALPIIYFYALNMLTYNIAPITDWRPFL